MKLEQPIIMLFEQQITRTAEFEIKTQEDLDKLLEIIDYSTTERGNELFYLSEIMEDAIDDDCEESYFALSIPEDIAPRLRHIADKLDRRSIDLTVIKHAFDNNALKPVDNETLKLFPDEENNI